MALLILSICTRLGVVLLLCTLAMWTEYLNLRVGYGNARLVELAAGPAMRWFYEASDAFFGVFGDPVVWAESTGGMTWSIRLLGVPFTDPVALLSVFVIDPTPAAGFALGALVPLTLAVTMGRVFCSYVCPASLLFYTIGRLRRSLRGVLLLPELRLGRGFAWGVLAGGLLLTAAVGHGVWTFVLPYFAIGQTLFHAIAFGTLSVTATSILLFALFDLLAGYQFTCRNLCPTGRLLGVIGARPLVSVRRDAENCVSGCNACEEVCPFEVSPRLDETRDCSSCGACLVICPTGCLHVGRQPHRTPHGQRKAAAMLGLLLCIAITPVPASAHHFKGLPHYSYFENYPQIPQDEFVGQEGRYEFSLVLYDFQGLTRESMQKPDDVRLFVIAFNLLENDVYSGAARLVVLDGEHPVLEDEFDAPQEENVYSLHGDLPSDGDYVLRMDLLDDGLSVTIPFTLSSQKVRWGRWVVGGLVALLAVAAVGARRARVLVDRRAGYMEQADR
jgi:ferredoxin-type protein NapH